MAERPNRAPAPKGRRVAPAAAPAAAPARRRLSAEQSRERILAAAERKLGEVGPEGLRLTDVAAELSISHPAILHHFGSREELVRAVVVRAMSRFNERLVAALEGGGAASQGGEAPQGREALLDMIAEFYGRAGNARLLAFLVLSRRTPRARARAESGRALERVIALAHARRVALHPEREIDFEDTRFRSQLSALSLLGDAIFGDVIRHASGDAVGAEASRAFRKRLARLLADDA
jgi:AcrR family transcriptional regulator